MSSTQVQSPKQHSQFNRAQIRAIAFQAHRWLGLTAGTLLCIAGVTGSILVFWHELDHWLLTQRFGAIIPTDIKASIPEIADTLKLTYADKNLTLNSLSFPDHADYPYVAWMMDKAEHYLQVFVNPYTGEIMGERQWETSWVGRIYELHYKLLAGDTGLLIMGIVALLTLILSITGIVLWPGWRRLAAGFKIKWHGHIKRLNFDLHKVFGIVTAVFLVFIGFTGFAWNVPQAKVTEAIYAVTLTTKPADPVSQPINGQNPVEISELLERADAAVPNATTTYISFPKKPEEVIQVGKRQAQETGKYGNTRVALDQFSGNIVLLQDGVKPSRAEAILNQFGAVHFGTFWGLPSRLLYVVVGLAPLGLFITGFVMWWHRRPSVKTVSQEQ